MPRLLTAIASIAIFLLPVELIGQENTQGTPVDISKVGLAKNISKYVYTTYINKNELLEKKVSSLNFKPGLAHNDFIPNNYVGKKAILKFTLLNTADSAISICFFPGYYYWDIHLYRLQDDQLIPMPSILSKIPDSIGYRSISLQAHDSVTLLAELVIVKTYLNRINPRLINPAYLSAFITTLHDTDKGGNMMTYVFCGLMIMMILFSITNFLQTSNYEFLYYSGYAFLLSLMLFTKALFDFQATSTNYFLEGYLDFIMQGAGIIFYMLFIQKFLDTKNLLKFLYHFYNGGMIMVTVALLGYSYFYFFTDNFVLQNGIENITKLLLLLMLLVFLIYSTKHWEIRLLRFMFWGNLCLLIFSLLSQASIMFNGAFKVLPGVLNSGLFYYETGLLLELVFFLAGLNYKSRSRIITETREKEKLKADNQMKEYEKELAIYKAQQEERDRISADMHDELGSGVTAIRLMSEIARTKMKEDVPPEIEKISQSADEVLNKMNVIIWSMHSDNDTLDNLVYYIRAYTTEYLEGTSINCKVNIPEHIPHRVLSGDKRRNIFLCVKESLTNVLKHSEASELTIDIAVNHRLNIKIADNGVGIDVQNLRQFGNGLKNIARRMQSIGGTFKIENDKGTITTLELPL